MKKTKNTSHLYRKVRGGGGIGRKKRGKEGGEGRKEDRKEKSKRHRNRKNEKIYSLSPGKSHRQVSHCPECEPGSGKKRTEGTFPFCKKANMLFKP